MGLLNDLNSFLAKYIKNPLVLGALTYTVFKMLQSYVSKESYTQEDSIRVERMGKLCESYLPKK